MSCLGKSCIWIRAELVLLLFFKGFWMIEDQLCSNRSLLSVCVLITFNIIMTKPGNRSSNANEKIDYFHRCVHHSVKNKNAQERFERDYSL